MNIWTVYSVLEEDHDYSALVESLGDFANTTIFVHFTETYVEYPGITNIVVDSFNNSKAWNAGFAVAKANGATHVLFAKNILDLHMNEISIGLSANELVPVVNFSDGALFSVMADYDFVANEQYNFWFADSEVFNSAGEIGAVTVYRQDNLIFEEVPLVSRKSDYDAAVESDIALSQ